MPEGDTVWRTARRLHQVLANQVLVTSDFRVPSYSTVDLTGSRVLEVAARGKHLLLRTDSGLTVHTHLKMEGSWHVYRVGGPWRGPHYQVRLIVATTEWVCVGFRLGLVEVMLTAAEESAVGHLGPDLLGRDWNLTEAFAAPAPRAGPASWRCSARPAQPGRDRQHVPVRGLLPGGRGSAYAGGLGASIRSTDRTRA